MTIYMWGSKEFASINLYELKTSITKKNTNLMAPLILYFDRISFENISNKDLK